MKNIEPSFAEVDTATLEAALESAISGDDASSVSNESGDTPLEETPLSIESEDTPNVTDGSIENEETDQQPTEQTEIAEDSTLPNSENEIDDSHVNESASNNRQHMAEYEILAMELRERNPDIALETALAMARQSLGLDSAIPDNESNEEAPEPTPDVYDRLKAIEAELTEEGANEGLFTAKIAELTREHARLTAEAAIHSMKREQEEKVESDRLMSLMHESHERVLTICPEAREGNSPIGRAMTRVIANLQSENSSILREGNCPEIIFAIANTLLPENERVLTAKPSPAIVPQKTKVQSTSEVLMAKAVQPPLPTGRALPVAASARTAQQQTENMHQNINPTQVGQLVRSANTENLAQIEQALYGSSGRDVLLRL